MKKQKKPTVKVAMVKSEVAEVQYLPDEKTSCDDCQHYYETSCELHGIRYCKNGVDWKAIGVADTPHSDALILHRGHAEQRKIEAGAK